MADERTDDAELQDELLAELMDGIKECRQLGYNPTAFQVMIHEHGALEAVRRLARPPVEQCSDGFTRLWEMKRLDLAVEHIVAYRERYAPLFTDAERETARQRLALYGYTGP